MTDQIQKEFEYNDHLYEWVEVNLLNLHLQYKHAASFLRLDIYKKNNDFLNIQNTK
jgi:hypothetical protein